MGVATSAPVTEVREATVTPRATIVEARSVHKTYDTGAVRVDALRGVSLGAGHGLQDSLHHAGDLFWASQDGAGAHVNVSGAGVVKSSDNPEQAQQLLEWLADEGQNAFVDANHEYPVNPDVEPEPLLAGDDQLRVRPRTVAAVDQNISPRHRQFRCDITADAIGRA